jgi:magnesium-transporting ATPase (P-type)
MLRPPRAPGTPILSRLVLLRTAVVAVLLAAGAVAVFLFEYHRETGGSVGHDAALAQAQTVAVTVVVLVQCAYLLQSRALRGSLLALGLWSNPWVYVGIGVLLVLQLGFVYLPFMNALFGSAPLTADAWAAALAVSLGVALLVGAGRMVRPGA